MVVFFCALTLADGPALQMEAARHLGGVYTPDVTAKGYVLTSVEKGADDGRPVVRMTYVNRSRADSFDLVEYVPMPGKSLQDGWSRVVGVKAVSVNSMPSDTLVLSRKKGVDVVFLSGTFSPGTANRLVARLVWHKFTPAAQT